MRSLLSAASFLVALLLTATSVAQTTPPLRIMDNGTLKPQRYKLNLVGGTVSCVDNSGAQRTDCTWSAGLTSVFADAPLSGDGSSGSHLSCPTCATGSSTTTFTNKSISGSTNTLSNIAQSSVTSLVSDLAAKAPGTRLINTTTPIQGGGDLTADLTLSIASGGVTNAMLQNPSATVTTSSPLGGGGTLTLGSGLTLTCSTCATLAGSQTLTNKSIDGGSNTLTGIAQSSVTNLTTDLAGKASTATTISAGSGLSGGGDLSANRTISMPATGPGAGTIGGGGTIVASVTLDAQGRVTAATTTSPSATVTVDSPLAGDGSSGSHITCATCLTGTPTTTGDLMASTSGGQGFTRIAAASAGKFLRFAGTGTAPAASTLVLPNAATTNQVMVATGTDTIGMATSLAGLTLTTATITTPTIATATSAADTAIIDRSAADTNGTTITPTSILTNSTAATVGAQKTAWEEICSNGWKTTATAGSQAMCSGWGNLPVQGTTNPNWSMVFYSRTNAGTRTARANLYWPNTGTITYLTGGGVGSTGTSAGGGIGMDSTGELKLFGGSGSTNHIRISSNNMFPSATNGISQGSASFAWSGVYSHEFEVVALNATTCATGTGAGTGASCSVQTFSPLGAGAIDVTTAGTPAGSDATIVTITGGSGNGFNQKGHCLVQARDATTATAMLTAAIYTVGSGTGSGTSTLLIKNASVGGLTTATTYKFTWQCMGGN